jgi:hypothetical protein
MTEGKLAKAMEAFSHYLYGKSTSEMYRDFMLKGIAFGKQFVTDENGVPVIRSEHIPFDEAYIKPIVNFEV